MARYEKVRSLQELEAIERFKKRADEQKKNFKKYFTDSAKDAAYLLNPFKAEDSEFPRLANISTNQPSVPSSTASRPPLLSASAPGSPATDHLMRQRQFSLGNTRPGNPVTNLPGGINLTHDREGNRIYTQGIQGQDGYAMARVPSSFANRDRSIIAQQGLINQTSTTPSSDMDILEPIAPPAQRNLTGRMIQAVSGNDYLPKKLSELEVPKYLGPESGLGWKTRAKLYEAQLDSYNKATGNQTALDIERMREAGAGQRSLAQANQWNVENQLNAKKIDSDLALAETQNKVGQLALLQEQNLQEARNNYLNNPTVENKNRLDRLLYDPKTQQVQADVRVIDQFSPLTGEKIGQTIMRDDGTGHYVDAMAPQQPQEHPAIAYLRKNNTPENRAFFIKSYGKLPEGF